MRVEDVHALIGDLKGYRSEFEEPATRAMLVEAALPRLLATLELLPEGTRESHLLELGSSPFFTSLAIDRAWPGRVSRANYFGTADKKGSQRQVGLDGRADKTYEFDLFNIEADEFPYPDETFNVVLFSELIEHLAVNPVWALSEIHRVLKKQGHVVITTPNALSLERLATYLRGGSQMVDRYSPLFGYGARHNREYHPAELRELLEATGFDVEAMVVEDLGDQHWGERLRRGLAKRVLRLWSPQPRDTHIFLRARRRDVFRWRFPPNLYDSMELYQCVRHPFVEMGVNDTIQCSGGWLPLEEWSETGLVRRVNGEHLRATHLCHATAYLRGRAGAARLVVHLRRVAGPLDDLVTGELRLRTTREEAETLASSPFQVRAGTWVDVAVPLARSARDREELKLELEVRPGFEIAVRRIWLDA